MSKRIAPDYVVHIRECLSGTNRNEANDQIETRLEIFEMTVLDPGRLYEMARLS